MKTADTEKEIKNAHARLEKMQAPKVWLVYAITIELPAFAHMTPERAAIEHQRLIEDFGKYLGVPAQYLARNGLQVTGTSRTIKVSDHYEQEWSDSLHNRFTVVSFDCQVDPNGAVVPDSVPSVGE